MEATAIADALYSRIAIVSGGRDLEENPIVIIDAQLYTHVANEHLEKVLTYFSSIFSTDTRRLGLCIIINAQKTTWRVTRIILHYVIEILRTDLNTIIVLRPEIFWDKQKVENCARLKNSNGPIYIPVSRLHKYVSSSHLPEELGGTWIYNHRAWIDNRIKVEGFVKLAENAVINLESYRHRLNNDRKFLEYKITENVCSISSETYEVTKQNILQTKNTGYALIEQLEKHHTDQQQHLITVPQDILDTKDRINRLLQIIQGEMTLVNESWNDVQKRNENIKEVMMIENGVCQVTNWILGSGEMLLNAQQNVGYDVISAEDLRRDHESLELQCRKPYGHYAEILHKLDVLAHTGIQFPQDLKSQKDFMDFVCRSFATRVERRRNVLITSARFFRFVSEYFQITSNVYENLVMRVDVEALESAQDTLKELENNLINIDSLEKELVKEGEKLSDLLSITVKDALGRELSVNYREDIINVQEILDMTIARRQLFKDSVELQKLTLQQVIHIHSYEKNAIQAIEWLNELYKVMLKSHSHIGCSVYEIQIQKEEHQCFQETAKGTFEFGCQLLQAALILRQSCKLSEEVNNTRLTQHVCSSWKKLYEVSQEQLTRLRVSAVFHRNVDQYSQELKKLTENFLTTVVEENNSKKSLQFKKMLLIRENILLEVGRTMRLGRLLKTRLREPLCSHDSFDEINDNNETAIAAISEKLSEVTILAERLDTTLCGFKFAMQSENIKKLLETTNTNNQEWYSNVNNLKISSEGSNKSESSKSDDDFVTASDCTATPPSRTSSFHTASEGELSSPWWEDEVENYQKNKSSNGPKQSSEEICSKINRGMTDDACKIKLSLTEGDSEKETIYREKNKNCNLINDVLESSEKLNHAFSSKISQKFHEEIQLQLSNDKSLVKNLEESKMNNIINQKQFLKNFTHRPIDNAESQSSVTNTLCYHERIMKRAITGIF